MTVDAEWIVAADIYQSMADACRTMRVPFPNPGRTPQIDGEAAVGAGLLWAYLRNVFTVSGRDTWAREEILVELCRIANNDEIFAPGCIEAIGDLYES